MRSQGDHTIIAAAIRSETERLLKEKLMVVAEQLVDDTLQELTASLEYHVEKYHLPMNMTSVIECIVRDGRSK